ncbi:MAG: thioredoxin domain-containing protein [Bacteroidota bacterium]
MPNHLIHESSPYLLQHAQNPVNWYPWGEEALEKARTENKLIVVSIGYAACHWCHVMEEQSFEDEEVARWMNEHFISIKIDREERPDIDKIYMDAVQLMTQQGGWPLNVVTLPDGRPIFGGTYFPKEHWINVLEQLSTLYRVNPQEAKDYADRLTQALQGLNPIVKMDFPKPLSPQLFQQIGQAWLDDLDLEWGGRKSTASKFPLPALHHYLLRMAFFLEDETLQEAAHNSLRKMALGGIYDHLGGGFARYSVDPYWKVPHFEKMLYDNAQLISLYAEAYQFDPQPLYQQVVARSMAFIAREMTSPEGGFYASLDADTEGQEGKYYTWELPEIETILGADSKLFADYYNAHAQGNWERTNVLFALETEEMFALKWGLDAAAVPAKLAAARAQLLAVRNQRTRPALDDKILASWNGMMLKACVDAYRVFGEKAYLDMALKNAAFIRDHLWQEGILYRNFKAGKATIPGFLDDYAFVIHGLTALYQLGFDESWLTLAQQMFQQVLTHFSDPATEMFFYTSDQQDVLIKRKTERQDDVIPSSNAVMAHILHQHGLLYGNQDWVKRAEQMLQNVLQDVTENPTWMAHWGQLGLKWAYPHYEVVVTGPEALKFRKALEEPFYPQVLFAGGTQASALPILADRVSDTTYIFVCEGQSCQLPVKDPEAARSHLHR